MKQQLSSFESWVQFELQWNTDAFCEGMLQLANSLKRLAEELRKTKPVLPKST